MSGGLTSRIFDIADYIYSKIIVVRYVNHTATLKLLAITTISVYTNSLLEEGFAFTANQAFFLLSNTLAWQPFAISVSIVSVLNRPCVVALFFFFLQSD